jgi:hypothetical protein
MKNFVTWFRTWEYLRDVMDGVGAGPTISKLVENTATDDELASVGMASFPKDISPELRQQAATTIARAYSPTA